jgi:tetratricopeptide (TPR) repeat protein
VYWSVALFISCLVIWGIAWSWSLLDQQEKIKKERAQESVNYLLATNRDERDILAAMERFPKTVVPFVKWAEFAFDRGDFETTAKRAEVIRQKFPREEIGFAFGAKALWLAGRHLEAKSLIDTGLRKLGRKPRLLAADGELALNSGDLNGAATIFAELRRWFPAERDGYTWGADCFEKLGNMAEADRLLRELIEGPIACDLENCLSRYARFAQDHEDWSEAARRWQIASDRLALVPEFHIGKSVALTKAGEWPKAVAVIESAKILFPKNPEVEAERQRLEERREFTGSRLPSENLPSGSGKPTPPVAEASAPHGIVVAAGESVEQPSEARVVEDPELALYLNAASVAQGQNDLATAQQNWAMARKRRGAPLEAWTLAAMHADETTALHLLEDAVSRFPEQALPYHDLARLEERQQDWIGAERAWRGFLAIQPGLWWAYAGLAMALVKQDRESEAEDVLRIAREQYPDDPNIAAEYARLANAKGDPSEAIIRWDAVIHRFPLAWPGYRGKAEALASNGQQEEADALLIANAAKFPNDPDALHDVARMAERLGKWTVAENAWQRFVEINPAMSWAYIGLAGAMREQGKFAEANSMLQDAAQKLPHDAMILEALDR